MNKHYCVLPFYSVETMFTHPNRNIFCCRLMPGTDINRVRTAINEHRPASECATCWSAESRGLKSEREVHNESMDFLLDLNIDNIELKSNKEGFNPLKIKLSTSNLCNGQCVTCNSTWSSSWARLEGRSSQYRSMELDSIDFSIDWSKIVSLSFVGGEPLLEKKNFDILEKIVELGNTNCFISIVTNGSIALTERQIEVLAKFPKLNICISIDGTGRSFEYMRYPLNWARLQSNIAIFKQVSSDVSVSCMISNLNIYYYKDFVNFFKEHNLNYLCKQIETPAIFSPGNLPEAVKEIVRSNNQEYLQEVNAFLSISKFNESSYERFKKEVARQDSLKGISLATYMPAVANFL